MMFSLRALGQEGFILDAPGTRVVIDPYLSDSVAEKYGAALTRQIPVVVPPGELSGVDWVLLTHAHLDHTDPDTLLPLAAASPGAKFLAPYECREILSGIGLGTRETLAPPADWMPLGSEISVRAIPAAHTALERNADGECRYVGYLFRVGGLTIYHAGDTIPHPEIVAALAGEAIDLALLPVNERNYYRDRADIVGNMTVREAFQLAAEIGARSVVPIHWDLFAPNRTHVAEIELLHQLERPPFELEIFPAGGVKLWG